MLHQEVLHTRRFITKIENIRNLLGYATWDLDDASNILRRLVGIRLLWVLGNCIAGRSDVIKMGPADAIHPFTRRGPT